MFYQHLLFFLAQSVVSESALTHYEYAERYVRQHATRVFLSYGLPPGGRYACGVARQRRAVAHAPARAVRSPQQADSTLATPAQAVALFLKRVTNASYFALITI